VWPDGRQTNDVEEALKLSTEALTEAVEFDQRYEGSEKKNYTRQPCEDTDKNPTRSRLTG